MACGDNKGQAVQQQSSYSPVATTNGSPPMSMATGGTNTVPAYQQMSTPQQLQSSPSMSWNTSNGQPPMSMIGGGTNLQPQIDSDMILNHPAVQQVLSQASPSDIINHPIVQNAIAQKMAEDTTTTGDKKSAEEIAFFKKYPGAPQMAFSQLQAAKAIQDSGLFKTDYQKAMENHPILMGLSNAAQAFGQGLTKQPYYTSNQSNQAELQKQSMSNIADMAKYGQITPEQQFQNAMRIEGLDTRKELQGQNQWSSFINKINPSTASSRSTVGMTANGNIRANRALATLQNNPVVTYQDLGNVVGDLAAIYQGGSPTDMGMKHQQYDSVQTRLANMKQFLTGQPQDAVPSAIKEKIIGTINSLKSVNNAALKQHLDSQEAVQKDLISKHPEEWENYRKQIESDYMDANNPQQSSVSGGLSHQSLAKQILAQRMKNGK